MTDARDHARKPRFWRRSGRPGSPLPGGAAAGADPTATPQPDDVSPQFWNVLRSRSTPVPRTARR